MFILKYNLKLSVNFVRRISQSVAMASDKYKEAVNCINSLQTNLSYRENHRKLKHSVFHSTSIRETEKYLVRSGISLEKLDKLSIIHVSGTKGKGSTCAFCESILRHHGYKTGFYSSPHLINIRERIKINGQMIYEDLFADHVISIYNKLLQQRENENDMPLYFRFLTIVAFHIFMAEKVDVAIVEVGIGGEFDCTNIVRKTQVVGITSLALDHTDMLGDTIDKIAWQKGGIMKSTARAFTVGQPEVAMDVLRQRAIERHCPLNVVPEYDEYKCDETLELGIHGKIQKINASLAIQLAHNWMFSYGKGLDIPKNSLIIPELTKQGLKNCLWPGRFQIVKIGSISLFLDGAHTEDSLKICTEWFINNSNAKTKALIFNMLGTRNSEKHLNVLQNIDLNTVIFVPNVAFKNVMLDDQLDLMNTNSIQLERCQLHKDQWINLKQNEFKPLEESILILSSIAEAIQQFSPQDRVDILVTGSLRLIGVVLHYLDLKQNNVNYLMK